MSDIGTLGRRIAELEAEAAKQSQEIKNLEAANLITLIRLEEAKSIQKRLDESGEEIVASNTVRDGNGVEARRSTPQRRNGSGARESETMRERLMAVLATRKGERLTAGEIIAFDRQRVPQFSEMAYGSASSMLSKMGRAGEIQGNGRGRWWWSGEV